MLYQPKEERPPYVQFEREAVKDKVASLAAGHAVYKDVDYVRLFSIGSKDSVVHETLEWFRTLERRVETDRFPAKWLEDFRAAYEFWKRGEDPPLEGTSVKNWSAATPAQVKTLIEANLRTVEDVAQAPEDAIRRLGMGGRALILKAQAFLEQAAGGQLSEKVAELQHEIDLLQARNKSLEDQLVAMRSMIPSPVVVEQPAPKGWLNEDDDAA